MTASRGAFLTGAKVMRAAPMLRHLQRDCLRSPRARKRRPVPPPQPGHHGELAADGEHLAAAKGRVALQRPVDREQ
jgi:hypothetical protein